MQQMTKDSGSCGVADAAVSAQKENTATSNLEGVQYRILLVEDDAGLVAALQEKGLQWDLDIEGCRDYRNVLGEMERIQPHLVILDIGLPFFDGYHWCREIRRRSGVPILFLSAMSDGMNQVMAMNMGGDDFVCKPFDTSVLIAKIRALLRRSYDLSATEKLLEQDGAVLDPGKGCLHYGNREIDLTRNELRILTVLLEQRGRVVSREHLMDALWATDQYIDDNTLTVNVNRLRKKLAAAGLTDFIHTKFGAGYRVGEEREHDDGA